MKTVRLFTIVALASLSLSFGCGGQETKEKTAKPVKAKAVEIHSASSSVRYSASIRPASQVEASFMVGGYIDSIANQKDPAGHWRYIQAGDVVRKGTVLARVRQSDFAARVNEAKSAHGEARSALDTNLAQLTEAKASVQTARAQVNDAEAYFERASLEFERAKTLFASQSITKPDYDAAKANFETARAKLDAARGQLKVAEARVGIAQSQVGMAQARIKTAEASTASVTIPLQDTELVAPLSAVVIERKVELGALVSTGTPGFVLADLTTVKAAFGVPDLALQSLKLGDTLHLTTDAIPGTEFSGHVSRISPSADQSSRVFDVEVTISNPTGALKPGMIASLIVNEDAGPQVSMPVVPLTAVTRSKQDPNSYAVYVVTEHEGHQVAQLRVVTLGESFGNTIAITEGLRAGEMVITTGATQVQDGEEVKVIP